MYDRCYYMYYNAIYPLKRVSDYIPKNNCVQQWYSPVHNV